MGKGHILQVQEECTEVLLAHSTPAHPPYGQKKSGPLLGTTMQFNFMCMKQKLQVSHKCTRKTTGIFIYYSTQTTVGLLKPALSSEIVSIPIHLLGLACRAILILCTDTWINVKVFSSVIESNYIYAL